MSGIQNAFGFMRGAAVVVTGQQQYTTPGNYSWVAPSGVTSISAIVVGAGAGGQKGNCRYCGCSGNTFYYSGVGGGAGGLAYKNNITVVPGTSYNVQVGKGGCISTPPTNSYFKGTCTIYATFGAGCAGGNGLGPCVVGFQGGQGGSGYCSVSSGNYSGGGGGGVNFKLTRGCSSKGGSTNTCLALANAGACGGASGGNSTPNILNLGKNGGGGGGLGLLGRGSSGAAPVCTGQGGNGGSGGSNGCNGTICCNTGTGGNYGGGGGGGAYRNGTKNLGGNGAGGAVRIIWPGTTRAFPSTCTGNL
jgi:hypothetical protein